tara:strand:- start:50491 stop:51741 length:1251 start_codon:yes stop_codon:yes gene_type:complete
MTEILHLKKEVREIAGQLTIAGSKSESNRLLILKKLYAPNIEIQGLSNSRDTQIMINALNSTSEIIDVEDAGTAMRFLLAYFAMSSQNVIVLKGSPRMHQRPIGILVEVLQKLGAKIEYLGSQNFPPLKIYASQLNADEIEIDSGVSSQFVSALMMIGPKLPNGLKIKLRGHTVSKPYINLSAQLMNKMGLAVEIEEEQIILKKEKESLLKNISVEADWSSASYWFLMASLCEKAKIELKGFQKQSLQGDSVIREIFLKLGVKSTFQDASLLLEKSETSLPQMLNFKLIDSPDLAQTLVVSMAALGIKGKISGLQTLKIKETDRLLALKTELEKTGAIIGIGDDYLEIEKGISHLKDIVFETWSDHRMAMSLASLALYSPISIKNPEVVNKSYPHFWEDMKKMGFQFQPNSLGYIN